MLITWTKLPCNSDSDEVMFHNLRFAMKTGVTQKQFAERLDQVDGLSAASRTFWDWIERRPPRAAV